MQGKSQETENKLFEIAESQQGYFTSRQAKVAGYKDNTHPYHVRSAHWVRVHRGIYRLAKFPRANRPDLNGYFVTTPYQTLADIISEVNISHELILQAVKTASEHGILTQAMLKGLLNEKSFKRHQFILF